MSKKLVRGPQLKLPKMDPAKRADVQRAVVGRLKKKVKAKGEPPRTARVRYLEPPTKKDGNPFFALRVPGGLLRAFKAHARKKDTTATALVREFMSKVTGVEHEEVAE